MGLVLKLLLLACGLGFVCTVFILLVKRRINERHSLLWLLGALVILALSTIPEILEVVADLAGVSYPPTLLFLFSILIILFIILYQSVQISLLQERLRELTQHILVNQLHSQSRVKAEEEKDGHCGQSV